MIVSCHSRRAIFDIHFTFFLDILTRNRSSSTYSNLEEFISVAYTFDIRTLDTRLSPQ